MTLRGGAAGARCEGVAEVEAETTSAENLHGKGHFWEATWPPLCWRGLG